VRRGVGARRRVGARRLGDAGTDLFPTGDEKRCTSYRVCDVRARLFLQRLESGPGGPHAGRRR
jgi:hypothetical protein